MAIDLKSISKQEHNASPFVQPLVVLDVRETWLRLIFNEVGRLTDTVGLIPSSIILPHDLSSAFGDKRTLVQQPIKMPSRSNGRLAPLLSRWNERLIQKIVPNPGAVVLTYPDQREMANRFSSVPKYYYASDDFTKGYNGWLPKRTVEWERQIVTRVRHVFAVSNHLAHRFKSQYGVPSEKITVVPNGMPARVIPFECPQRAHPARHPLSGCRPLAGMIGTISDRLRLDWICQAVDETPWLNWAFIGPVIKGRGESAKLIARLQANRRCIFVGPVSYEGLFEYAACFDVGIIPLSDAGINPSCSPVRLFTLLPFGLPIVATTGCDQLAEFSACIDIVGTAEAFVAKLYKLYLANFEDGKNYLRWRAAQLNTWESRARQIVAEINN